MGRETKFRAFWNGNIFRVNTVSMDGLTMNIDLTGFEGHSAHESKWVDALYEPKAILIQYTGLKDKSGKEIYEFDVIIHNDNQYVIRYSDNLGIIALATTKEYSSFEGIVKRNHRYRDQAWLYNVQKYLSVIGNVFENPELLGDIK